MTLTTELVIGSGHRIVIGDDAIVGAAAIVVGRGSCGLSVGARAKIWAQAVVTNDVLADQTVVGVPARPVPSGQRRDHGTPQ